MLEAWSRTRDGTRKLSANFTVAEVSCRYYTDSFSDDSGEADVYQSLLDHKRRTQEDH